MARIQLNAWREIINRIFEGFEVKQNVNPTWLINPETKRPLKLDWVYPQIGVAVKLQGLKSKQKRRRDTLDEEDLERKREAARKDVCKAHGINLATLNLSMADYGPIFSELELTLSWATIQLKKNKDPLDDETKQLLEQLSQARSKVSQFRRSIQKEANLSLYTNLWQDRQYQLTESNQDDSPPLPLPPLEEGMVVDHSRFGEGLIVKITGSGDDALVSIEFEEGGERTFMLNLLGNKLKIS